MRTEAGMLKIPTRSQTGFTLMELLVTIVLAAIVFLAMVPLFVQAQQANASDTFRNIALNIAQEKIEKIRSLDYDSVAADKLHPTTTSNLYNASFAGGQFGSTEVSYSGAANPRTFSIDYTVTPVTDAVGKELYKKVIVDVYWVAPPKVKHAILETLVYRQYAGPTINTFSESPLQFVPETGDWFIPSTPVTLTAKMDPNDIATTGSVTIKVLDHKGIEVFSKTVAHNWGTPGDPTNSGTYTTTWSPVGYVDGTYTFTAQAVSGNAAGTATEYAGLPWSKDWALETGPPTAPTGLTATPLASSIVITWTPSKASDIDHYVLYRNVDDATQPATPYVASLSPTLATSGYPDTAVSLGHTYYYWLVAVDLTAAGPASAVASAHLTPPSDTTPPSNPTNLTATSLGGRVEIDLAWTASTDNVGVDHYRVYRSTSVSATWPTGWTDLQNAPAVASPTFVDNGGVSLLLADTLYYYRVVAYDAAGNVSTGYAQASATTSHPVATSSSVKITAMNNYSGGGNPSLIVQLYTGTKSGTHTLVGSVTAAKGKSWSTTFTSVVNGPCYTVVTFNSGEQTGKEWSWTHGGANDAPNGGLVTYP